MIGSFFTSGLVLIFGYAYPAYECYKTVEMNKPEVEQLRFWCQYWILVALMAVCEHISDIFISWVPMYSEAKLAFYIYLWYSKRKGTVHVYESFVKPYIAKHEKDIDRHLMELKTRSGDLAVMYLQKSASHGQRIVSEVLQFVASQATTISKASSESGVKKKTPDAKEPASEADLEQTEPAQETDLDDAIRAAHSRLRKTKSVVIKKDA